MAMRVWIEDTGMELSISVSASGGYAPDVVHDLQQRALEAYKDAFAVKMAYVAPAEDD